MSSESSKISPGFFPLTFAAIAGIFTFVVCVSLYDKLSSRYDATAEPEPAAPPPKKLVLVCKTDGRETFRSPTGGFIRRDEKEWFVFNERPAQNFDNSAAHTTYEQRVGEACSRIALR